MGDDGNGLELAFWCEESSFFDEDWVKVVLDGTLRDIGLKNHGDISDQFATQYHDSILSGER